MARLGGDEFAILQKTGAGQGEAALAFADRLLAAMREPYDLAGSRLAVATSIGIALAPQDGNDADQLLKNADLALYRAKSEGRNRCRLFDAQMDAEARTRHALEIDLRNAIWRDEFELHYQIVIRSETREVCGVEALVRWRHPQRGLLAPGDFIAITEETGLIVPLGEWILRRACADAAAWPAHIKLAVNLSAAQFSAPDLTGAVATALSQSGLPPERLELEITESVLLENDESNLAVLHALRGLGVAIVLDDFGTGYSSLSYLQKFPFDKLKIDRSFVSELSSRSDSAAIVCAVSSLGKTLNILTTAEGIETEQQFDLLRATGVDQMLGFLFGVPVPKAELSSWCSRAGRKRPHSPPATGRTSRRRSRASAFPSRRTVRSYFVGDAVEDIVGVGGGLLLVFGRHQAPERTHVGGRLDAAARRIDAYDGVDWKMLPRASRRRVQAR